MSLQSTQDLDYPQAHGASDAMNVRALDQFAAEQRRECRLDCGDYVVRRVETWSRLAKARALIRRMYEWRGYDTENLTAKQHGSDWIVLEASREEQLLGTLTLGIDSGRLLADALYEPEINAFRNQNRKACEISRLAVDPQHSSKELLASLFHLAYIYVRIINKASDVFIEVNPRHAGFYTRMLGFQQIGERRVCPRVDAPAVLLHLELEYMGVQIAKYLGSSETRGRSLYPYFFADCAAPEYEQMAKAS